MKKKKVKIEFVDAFHGLDFPLTHFRTFVQLVSHNEKIPVGNLRIIVVDDEYLSALHKQFLQDDSYTDVMVFPLDDHQNKEAEIYLSGERAKENASRYGVTLKNEIARLIAHALLHLQGFNDQTRPTRKKMHFLENQILEKYWNTSD
jgi:probable rRNA maturation factor